MTNGVVRKNYKGMGSKWPVAGRLAKAWAREHVRGQWVALMGAVTADDGVDEEGIRTGVRQTMRLNVGGLACSSLFEPWSSTHDERRLQLEVFLDEVGGKLPVYATVTDHSIKETVRLAQHAFKHGAAIVTINCPYEHAKSDSQIIAFYKYVCSELDGPVALYNTPHSGTVLSPELIAELVQIENVCAIKNAIGNFEHTARLFALVGDEIVVSNPSERDYLRHILEHGQQALFSTTATHLMQSPAWQPIEEYARAARAGETAKAAKLYEVIEPLRAIWDDLYSVLWGKHVGPAQHPITYTKYWQELMGIPAGPPRPPLPRLSDTQKAEFRHRLESTGLLQRFGVTPWAREAA